jgi:hypothetical protein
MNLAELFQFGFIGSIIFMVYILLGVAMKFYGKFVEKEDAKFLLTTWEKILLWTTISYIFTYLI